VKCKGWRFGKVLEKPHKKLDVWQKSIVLIQKIYNLTKLFPRVENFGLINQMRRATVSIAANIAEGAGRQTKKEFIQFLHMAQGSLSELDTHLEISEKLGYLGKNNIQDLSLMMNDIDKMLTGLIKSLKK
jgi:four helix bundle protein